MTALLVALALTVPAPRLTARPPQLVVGQRWTATLVAPAPPRVRARLGGRTVTFRTTRVAAARYRAVLVFQSPGTWRLTATIGRRETPLTRMAVVASYPLASPAGILARDDRSLLVVERGGRDRVLHVRGDGRFTTFARDVPAPWGLAAAGGGALVSGNGGIYRISGPRVIYRISGPRVRAQQVASVDAGPFLVAPGGDLYYANRSEVGRVRAGSTRAETFAAEVSAPHGLALDGDALYVSDSGNGRILRIDVRSGRVTVHAVGLRNVLGIELEPDGTLLAVEFDTGRLLRIDAAGRTSVVAVRLVKPYALDRAADGTVWVVETGELRTPTGRIARVGADGAVARLRLVPG